MAVLSIYSLPDVLYSKLHTTTISISENDGTICIEPAARTTCGKKLRGMFSDGKLGVDKHLEMMRQDRETFEK